MRSWTKRRMSWSFGWAFSPQVSGWIQETYGFGPVFLGTGAAYTIATILYQWFFGRRQPSSEG